MISLTMYSAAKKKTAQVCKYLNTGTLDFYEFLNSSSEKRTTIKILVKICANAQTNQKYAHALHYASCVHVQHYFANIPGIEDRIFTKFET